ncbi:MAG: hypothetical protein QOJ46_476 [bacterium]|jgi:hypothetical protein
MAKPTKPPTPRPLYAVPVQQATQSGDLDEMKAVAEEAERHVEQHGDVGAALQELKAEIAKMEAGSEG